MTCWPATAATSITLALGDTTYLWAGYINKQRFWLFVFIHFLPWKLVLPGLKANPVCLIGRSLYVYLQEICMTYSWKWCRGQRNAFGSESLSHSIAVAISTQVTIARQTLVARYNFISSMSLSLYLRTIFTHELSEFSAWWYFSSSEWKSYKAFSKVL